jgi:hypothetical protein
MDVSINMILMGANPLMEVLLLPLPKKTLKRAIER